MSAVRAVVQRVRRASVAVEEEAPPPEGGGNAARRRVAGTIGPGLVVFLGIRRGDGDAEVDYMAEKVVGLRILPDEKHSMNRSIRDCGGGILLVSQFTLYGDCRRGRRPSFDEAEAPERAEHVYRSFVERLTALGFRPQEGVFGASMVVELENDGPVTILLDSEKRF